MCEIFGMNLICMVMQQQRISSVVSTACCGVVNVYIALCSVSAEPVHVYDAPCMRTLHDMPQCVARAHVHVYVLYVHTSQGWISS